MNRFSLILHAITLTALTAGSALASVEVCDRVTHAAHGGSEGHEDLGRGKVTWTDWWSLEGVYKDVWVADCRTGIALSLRTSEERIADRHVVDRTERAVDTITRQAEIAPAFFTVERIANMVRKDGVDLTIAQYGEEFCACNVAYPELRGNKTPYEANP